MTPEILLENLEEIKNSKVNTLMDSLMSAVESIFVKIFQQGNERPCEEDDYSYSKNFHETQIIALFKIIELLEKNNYFCELQNKSNFHPKLLALILILYGENCTKKPWNTHEISKNNPRKLIKEVLEILRPKLLSETWKQYPAAVEAYKWFLQFIEQPELSHHLSAILPTSLLLVDDFINENRILGVQCLHHIISNLTLAELQYHGYGDVIYNALLPLIRIREAAIISEAGQVLIMLTSKLETDIGQKNFAKWSKFDDVLEILLENMELESQLDLRSSYIKILDLILSVSKLDIVRWTKRLLRIFQEYLENGVKYNDAATVNYTLKGIINFTKVTELARAVYAKDLLFVLLSVLYGFTEKEANIKKDDKDTLISLIKELNVLTSDEKKELKTELNKQYFKNFNYYNIVVEVLNLN